MSTSPLPPEFRIPLALIVSAVLMVAGFIQSRENPELAQLRDHGQTTFCEPQSAGEETRTSRGVGRYAVTQYRRQQVLECSYFTPQGTFTQSFDVNFDLRAKMRELEYSESLLESPFMRSASGREMAAKKVELTSAHIRDLLKITYLPENPNVARMGNVNVPTPSLANFPFITGVLFAVITVVVALSLRKPRVIEEEDDADAAGVASR